MSDLSIAPYFPFARVVLVGSEIEAGSLDHRSVISFRSDDRYNPVCSGCGKPAPSVHSSWTRRIADLSLCHSLVELRVPSRKVRCQRCGIRVEQHDFVEPYRRMTRRLERAVEELLRVTSIDAVATHFGLSWSTVKEIDKRRLTREVGQPNYDGLRLLAIDEVAVHKGHRYMTIVLDLESGRVVWVGRGRSADTLRAFFSELSPDQIASISAIAVDMSPSYTEAISECCPEADIVYDLFHVAAKYGREVINRVRVDEYRKCSGEDRRFIKGSKYLLLGNFRNLEGRERQRLKELLSRNRTLSLVYIMKDQLKQIWWYRSDEWARKAFTRWCNLAEGSGIGPLRNFARQLRRFALGILSHCKYPIHTSRIEGVNNRIKVLKRIAYGFRDDDYFILKIKGAFPGNPLHQNPR